jgi:hypothetical protein
MSEERMRELAQAALQHMGIDDDIIVAGEFSPRGRTGAGFVGGMLGSELGGTMGSIGDAAGLVGDTQRARTWPRPNPACR